MPVFNHYDTIRFQSNLFIMCYKNDSLLKTLEDFVSDSPEEIKEAVKNHIPAVVPYSDSGQSEEALEQDRFFF